MGGPSNRTPRKYRKRAQNLVFGTVSSMAKERDPHQDARIPTPPAPGLPSPDAGDWFVLHTRSRQEKALSADLTAMRIAHYLPLVRQVRYYGKRKAIVDLPLFPGYVFLRGTSEQAYRADDTNRVACILRVPDQARLDWELRNLHLALSRQVPLDPYPFLKRGVRVEVRSGPLRGLQGIVEHRGPAGRLILQVDMVAKAVSLEIDAALLEPIE